MPNTEVIALLNALSWEIKHLRNICADMGPKAEAYTVIKEITLSLTRRGGAMEGDILQRVDEVVSQLSAPIKKAK